jgi:hypothetical protein
MSFFLLDRRLNIRWWNKTIPSGRNIFVFKENEATLTTKYFSSLLSLRSLCNQRHKPTCVLSRCCVKCGGLQTVDLLRFIEE